MQNGFCYYIPGCSPGTASLITSIFISRDQNKQSDTGKPCHFWRRQLCARLRCFCSVWSATVQRISCLFCDWGRVFDSARSEPEFIAVLVLTGTRVGKAESRAGQEDPTPLIQLWLTRCRKNAARRIISGIFLQRLSIKHLSQILDTNSDMFDFTVKCKRRKR